MTTRIRLLQVGLGPWGLDWAQEILPTVERVALVGYVDIAAEARARLRTAIGVSEALCHDSLEGALTAVDCDAVLVTLPARLHFPAARIALEAGKHVLVEKPFTTTLEEAQTLVDQARARQRVLMVSQNYRFYPAPIAAADLVTEGRLGPLTAIEIDFRRHVASAGYRYWDLAQPLLSDMSIHHVDLLRMVTGATPSRVACRSWVVPGSSFQKPTSAYALIAFETGLTVSYRASIDNRGADTPWAGEWAMDMGGGRVWWTSRGNPGARLEAERLTVRRRGELAEAQALPKLRHVDRAGTTEAFAQAVIEGSEPPRFSSGRDNLGSLATMEALIRSADADGAWVAVAELLKPHL